MHRTGMASEYIMIAVLSIMVIAVSGYAYMESNTISNLNSKNAATTTITNQETIPTTETVTTTVIQSTVLGSSSSILTSASAISAQSTSTAPSTSSTGPVSVVAQFYPLISSLYAGETATIKISFVNTGAPIVVVIQTSQNSVTTLPYPPNGYVFGFNSSPRAVNVTEGSSSVLLNATVSKYVLVGTYQFTITETIGPFGTALGSQQLSLQVLEPLVFNSLTYSGEIGCISGGTLLWNCSITGNTGYQANMTFSFLNRANAPILLDVVFPTSCYSFGGGSSGLLITTLPPVGGWGCSNNIVGAIQFKIPANSALPITFIIRITGSAGTDKIQLTMFRACTSPTLGCSY